MFGTTYDDHVNSITRDLRFIELLNMIEQAQKKPYAFVSIELRIVGNITNKHSWGKSWPIRANMLKQQKFLLAVEKVL